MPIEFQIHTPIDVDALLQTNSVKKDLGGCNGIKGNEKRPVMNRTKRIIIKFSIDMTNIILFRIFLTKVKLKATCWMIKHTNRLFVPTINQIKNFKRMRRCTLEIWMVFFQYIKILEWHLQFQKVINKPQSIANFYRVLSYPAYYSIIHIKSILVFQTTFLASVVKIKVYILMSMRAQKVVMMNSTLLTCIVIVAISHPAPMSTIDQ